MCGLVGLWNLAGDANQSLAIVSQMAGSLRHRGPDSCGVWRDNSTGLAFGFQRLSIFDVSEMGQQPMASVSGRYTIVFNGAVYNFVELRSILESDGFVFRGVSDTEVLLAAFEKWGVEGSVSRFFGMFAIAVWDAKLKRLSLIRDRLGIKPLFLYRDSRGFAFASELTAFHAVPGLNLSLSQAALSQYFRYLYVRAPATIYSHVVKIPPGVIVELDASSDFEPRYKTYWDLQRLMLDESDRGRHSVSDLQEDLEDLIRDSVRMRMRADVPIGAFLSGGIDSTLIVATMRKFSTGPIHTYTVGFDSEVHDESRYAAEIAAHLGTEHHSLHLSNRDLIDLVPNLSDLLSEPLGDPSHLPLFLVCKAARDGISVALSGDGGDELFGGYNRYVFGEKAIRSAHRIPQAVRWCLGAGILTVPAHRLDKIGALVAPGRRGGLLGTRAHKIGYLLQAEDEWRMYDSLLSAWQVPPVPSETATTNGNLAASSITLGDRMMLWDQLHYLPGNLLMKTDLMSMANSMEVRVPLLDHRIVEHSWKFPIGAKIENGIGKLPLRRMLDQYVPPMMMNRPKTGFTVPLSEWLRGSLREWAGDHILHAEALIPDFDGRRVRKIWDDFQKGDNANDLALWTVVSLATWIHRWSPR